MAGDECICNCLDIKRNLATLTACKHPLLKIRL